MNYPPFLWKAERFHSTVESAVKEMGFHDRRISQKEETYLISLQRPFLEDLLTDSKSISKLLCMSRMYVRHGKYSSVDEFLIATTFHTENSCILDDDYLASSIASNYDPGLRSIPIDQARAASKKSVFAEAFEQGFTIMTKEVYFLAEPQLLEIASRRKGIMVAYAIIKERNRKL